MSDMILLSEAEGDGSPSAPTDQGRELIDADGERLAGAKRRAPIAGLLDGAIDRDHNETLSPWILAKYNRCGRWT